MLGLGRKTAPSLDRFSIENWDVRQGEYEGRPVIARINRMAAKYVGHPELPVRLGVTVAFHSPNEHGFCNKEEGEQVGVIEDQLIEALAAEKIGYLVLVITTNGNREFVFYVRDGGKALAAASQVAAKSASHRIQSGTLDDPEWSYFARFA
jgi:hypothetical protein